MCDKDSAELFAKLENITIQLMRRMHAIIKAQSAGQGVTSSQIFFLRIISEHGRVTVSTIAEEAGVSLSAVTALTDRLVKSGFVTRSREENDRRLVWLEVTPKGEEILINCLAGRKQIMERFFKELSANELRQLTQIYEKLLASLERDMD